MIEYNKASKLNQIKLFFTPKRLIILLILILVIIAIVAVYFYVQYRNATTNPNTATINAVGQLIILPNESPTVATVTDKSKLSGDTFFNNARNGDKVLIYLKSKVVILYRPSIGKIVSAAFGTQAVSATSATNSSQSQTLSIAIYNASSTTELGAQVQQKILASITNITVPIVQKSNHQYSSTTVIDLTGDHSAAATQLAGFLNATIGPLPPEESKPKADLLVIIGNDFLLNQVQ